MLLLDYNDDLSLQTLPKGDDSEENVAKEKINFDMDVESIRHVSAKIHINTLSPYTGFGGGIYSMTGVKRMTASSDFLRMPWKDKNCEVESYDDCRTRKLLEQCNCAWLVPGWKVKLLLQNFKNKIFCPWKSVLIMIKLKHPMRILIFMFPTGKEQV